MQGLKDKVAIVSGGSTLIGAAVARAFVAQGTRVVVADIDQEGGRALAAELGEAARFVTTDVADDAAIEACVDDTLKAFGRIDFLVNVAALYADQGPLSPRADWEKAFAVNLFGAAMFLNACRPHMAPGSAVVNFGSTSASVAQAGRWTYPASKAAVLQLTRSAALDLAGAGIRVNAVSPGWTWSGILDQISGGDRDRVERVARPFHMLGRIGDPAEVADAVLFLCSGHARFITGTNLAVDGGYTALGPEQALSPITELLS
ncbi:SDR family oxidoreductase [Parasulfuritortus cantonensis]|uniref:SDR family oxidoreductase n=1 Tax=Parasulfuritortus cantonensis TaxID=2528202 RepID=A0A4R1BCW2_9PROT|nr:SDR family oxidoreductase [Parasulfuritortus cantonensis]TCJ14911.1 SDR family oxidoreductase [Parasulfuritortus cantonensis]